MPRGLAPCRRSDRGDLNCIINIGKKDTLSRNFSLSPSRLFSIVGLRSRVERSYGLPQLNRGASGITQGHSHGLVAQEFLDPVYRHASIAEPGSKGRAQHVQMDMPDAGPHSCRD